MLSCPSGIAVSTASGFGAALEFSSSAADNCPGAPSVQCNHVSGGIFPVGETAVTCTSTDSSGNTGNCTFPAKVNGNVNIDSLPGERPVCTGGAKIRRATLVVKNIGGASPGGQSATLKGSVKFTKSVYPLISGQAHGAQIQLADVGNGNATLFELSERTDPVAAGILGGAGACGSGDGWSSTNVYANTTNRLGSPTCIDASANGLRCCIRTSILQDFRGAACRTGATAAIREGNERTWRDTSLLGAYAETKRERQGRIAAVRRGLGSC